MLKLIAAFALSMFASSAGALAQGMPSYDVNDNCRKLANGNYAFERACRQSENGAREKVQHENVDSDVWRNCVRLSGSSGNYAFLQACIHSESGAKHDLGYGPGGHTLQQAGSVASAPAVPFKPRTGDPPERALTCGEGNRMTANDGCQPARR